MPTRNVTLPAFNRQIEDIPGEKWKDVVGYAGYYQVSNKGRVKTLGRIKRQRYGRGGSNKIVNHHYPAKIMKLNMVGGRNNHDYLYANLRKHNDPKPHLVHRMVLEAFVEPCPEGMECRHLNGNGHDNRLRNLVWGTKQGQLEDKKRHGTHKPLPKRYKTTPEVRERVRQLYATGLYTQKELGNMFGLAYQTVAKYIRLSEVSRGAS